MLALLSMHPNMLILKPDTTWLFCVDLIFTFRETISNGGSKDMSPSAGTVFCCCLVQRPLTSWVLNSIFLMLLPEIFT